MNQHQPDTTFAPAATPATAKAAASSAAPGIPAGLRCALFDFDGVIADTEPLGIARIADAVRARGLEFPDKHLYDFIGTDALAADKILSENGIDLSFDQLMESVADRPMYYETGVLEPMPGVAEFVSSLRERGILTGVVSSTRASWILAALNHLSMTGLFDSVVCGDMVDRHKPDPECYLRSLKNLGIPAEKGVAFEDSRAGISAARAAGLFVVGFEGSIIEQDTGEANVTLSSFEGVPASHLVAALTA